MNFKNETLEELQSLLLKMENEKEAVDARVPEETTNLHIAKVDFEKAQDKFEYAEDRLKISKGRSEQLVGIIEAIKKEIETR